MTECPPLNKIMVVFCLAFCQAEVDVERSIVGPVCLSPSSLEGRNILNPIIPLFVHIVHCYIEFNYDTIKVPFCVSTLLSK